MGLLDKHLGYRAPLDGIRAVGADPSAVRFDAVLSPTLAERRSTGGADLTGGGTREVARTVAAN